MLYPNNHSLSRFKAVHHDTQSIHFSVTTGVITIFLKQFYARISVDIFDGLYFKDNINTYASLTELLQNEIMYHLTKTRDTGLENLHYLVITLHRSDRHHMKTHKVNTNGADVALSVCVILQHPHIK